MDKMFFDGWMIVLRTIILGSLSYVGLIIFLRISGKRTLSKMNMFDFIVTVAFGSTLATVILSKDVSLVQGLVGLGLLVLLQFLITFFEVRNETFMKLIKSSPSLLYFNNEFRSKVMKRERVTEQEIRAALRQKGYAQIDGVTAVILETDGTFSILSGDEVTQEGLAQDGVLVD